MKCLISTLLSSRVNLLKLWSLVEESIRYLNLLEIIHKKEIMIQQILAMELTFKGEKKYKTETLIRAFEYFVLFRSTYSKMREDYKLPSRDATRI